MFLYDRILYINERNEFGEHRSVLKCQDTEKWIINIMKMLQKSWE
jgi:hypothetical protein